MAESQHVDPGKIYVGGLSWETTKESLIEHFSRYGEVIDGVIMIDGISRLPRGFGFVTFKDPASVTAVIQEHEHYLDGKKIDPKLAKTRDHQASSVIKSTSIDNKVFVGGLPHDCSVDELKSHFSKYGQVSEVDMKIDRVTLKPRGFAFVEFQDSAGALEAMKKQFQMFKDKRVEVKPVPNSTHSSKGYVPDQSYPPSRYSSFQSGQTSAYQSPQSYPPSHSGTQQQAYAQHPQHPHHSYYQPNEYQQYGTAYQQPNYSTGYVQQQGYSATPGYSQQYSSNPYPGQSDSVAYAPSQLPQPPKNW